MPEPIVQIPQPSATTQASVSAEPETPPTRPKSKRLDSWQQVQAEAPPLTVPSAAPPGDKSEIEKMNQVVTPVYALLESVWSSAPVACAFGQPKCAERWTVFEDVMWRLNTKIIGLVPLCGRPYNRTATAVRYRAHINYLRARHEQLRKAADRAIAAWKEKDRMAHMAAHPPRVMMRPCLSCVAPMGMSHTGRMVEFDSGSATLDADDKRVLDSVARGLQRRPNARVRVQGHADSAESQPKQVAAARAKATLDYLVSKGVAKSQLVAVNLAATLPISNAHGNTALNRRADFESIP